MTDPGAGGLFRLIVENVCEGVVVVDRERKVLYWSPAAERITGYSSAEVTGQSACPGVLALVDDSGDPLGADRCPLALTLADGVPREANIHLRHRDGHRVPVCLRPVALRDEHGEISGGLSSLVETFTPAGEARLAGAPEGIDSVDALTGVGGRRATELRLGESVGELRRYGWPFGVVVLDVGDLARVNHTYGRQAGDRVLRTVARALNASSRPFDVVGRWSGDEFLVLVKNVDEDQLERVADRLRSLVSSTVVPLDPAPIRVTASTGTASAEPQDTPVSLAARARLGRPRTADAGTPSS